MCLRVSYKKKWEHFFFCILNFTEERRRGTDPRIRIRTKMLRIPNTVWGDTEITSIIDLRFSQYSKIPCRTSREEHNY
jgi:hypothetical protein